MNNIQSPLFECNKTVGGQEAWRLHNSLGRGSITTWKHFIQKSLDEDFLKALVLLENFNTTKPRKAILAAIEKQLSLIAEK